MGLEGYLVTALQTGKIKAMLDTIPGTSYQAIIVGRVLPELLQSLRKVIQIYRVSPINAGENTSLLYNVNCWQPEESDADALAELVYKRLNREFATHLGAEVYAQCIIQPCIYEEEHSFNTPVEVRLFSKGKITEVY